MITVKLYGLLRVDYGVKERRLEAETVKDVLDSLAACGIPKKELEGCAVFVNGDGAGKRKKLTDGDTVALMSPVAGG